MADTVIRRRRTTELPDKPVHPAPRPKDAPKTMRELRLAHAGRRKALPRQLENVLREGLRLERVPDPSILVLFGATGDLAHRKVMPALYQLWRTNLLPHEFVVLAIGRRPYDNDTFRDEIRGALEKYSRVLPLDEPAWRSFSERVEYEQLNFDEPAAFDRLAKHLDTLDEERGTRGNRLFYLATQPSQFSEIVAQLGRVGLDHELHDGGWRRVVIEKPFGHDLASAQKLNREVGKVFRESQVYRIDHYLGKETVRNLMVFRFGNSLFEPLWNRRYVDHIQITVAESMGIENRGAFYEETGAARDVLQNHLLQLVSLVGMEPPATFQADALRDEKVKVLRAIAADPARPSRRRHRRRSRRARARARGGPVHSSPGELSMRIGFIGLGRMGANMVRRLVRDGHEIAVYNRTPEKTKEIAGEGAIPSFSIEELVDKLEKPRTVWIMVPAGDATEAQIAELMEHLEPGDTIVDGGNTNFHDDQRRHPELKAKGINYVDAGVSGGIWGLQVGYCLMVGGEKEAVEPLVPIFTTLAPPNGYLHVGGPGAGHYVKMVHNGIEYGLMQAYAEGFEIMHASDYDLDLGGISELWMQGSVVRSWLLELAGRAFRANGKDLEHLKGWVADSGEGRWTVQESIDRDVPAPVITLSLQMRFRSRQDDSYGAKVLAALRNEFGGHAVKTG